MMVGVWLENEEMHPEPRKSNTEQVLRGIELANKYTDIVAAVFMNTAHPNPHFKTT